MPLTYLDSDYILDRGLIANDNLGDTLREAAFKINNNFEDLDSAINLVATTPLGTTSKFSVALNLLDSVGRAGTLLTDRLGVGDPVYYDTSSGLWTGAYADSERYATHVIVRYRSIDSNQIFEIASTGTFNLDSDSASPTLTANREYYLPDSAGGALSTVKPLSGDYQELYYALDSDTIDVNIGTHSERRVYFEQVPSISGGQTVLSGLDSVNVTDLDVYKNGILLSKSLDYVVNSETQITMITSLDDSDIVRVRSNTSDRVASSGGGGATILSDGSDIGVSYGVGGQSVTLSFDSAAYIKAGAAGQPNGVAQLNASSVVPVAQIPNPVPNATNATFATSATNADSANFATTAGTATNATNATNADSAATAAKWTIARTITFGGDLTGSFSIDGSQDVTANATVTGGGSGGFVSGTKMLFQQAAAPTGWTIDTTHDNKALRIVNGTVTPSSGGSVAFTTAFATSRAVSGSVGGTSLTEAQLPSHDHGDGNLAVSNHSHDMDDASQGISEINSSSYQFSQNYSSQTISFAGGNVSTNVVNSINLPVINNANFSVSRLGNTMNTGNQSANITGNTGNAGSGSTHTHPWSGSVNVGVQYVDFIICTKT